jgi:hypothetical protein
VEGDRPADGGVSGSGHPGRVSEPSTARPESWPRHGRSLGTRRPARTRQWPDGPGPEASCAGRSNIGRPALARRVSGAMPWAASWQNFKFGPDSDPAVRPRPRAKGQSLGPVSRGQPVAARPGQWSIADRRAAVGGAAAESMSRARAPPVSHHSRGATARAVRAGTTTSR